MLNAIDIESDNMRVENAMMGVNRREKRMGNMLIQCLYSTRGYLCTWVPSYSRGTFVRHATTSAKNAPKQERSPLVSS